MPSENSKIDFSVVIPAYNESKRISPTILKTSSYLEKANLSHEIIVVDDGSSDNTVQVVEEISKTVPGLKIIKLARNSGKGAAVKEGMLAAVGDLVLFEDADGATPIAELDKLRDAMKSADVAIGSRALPSEDTKVVTRIHRKLLGRIFNLTANMFAVPGILDTQCGFKLFTKPAAQAVFAKQKLLGFGFDVEILYIANKLGFRIKEVAVNWNNVPGTKVNVILDGLKMFLDIVSIKLLHRSL